MHNRGKYMSWTCPIPCVEGPWWYILVFPVISCLRFYTLQGAGEMQPRQSQQWHTRFESSGSDTQWTVVLVGLHRFAIYKSMGRWWEYRYMIIIILWSTSWGDQSTTTRIQSSREASNCSEHHTSWRCLLCFPFPGVFCCAFLLLRCFVIQFPDL